MQKWEYLLLVVVYPPTRIYNEAEDVVRVFINDVSKETMIVRREEFSFRALMDELGEEGWELTTAKERQYIFKRPKS